jgi:hypothetical protein
MSAVAGWAGCWWWAARNCLRLLGWPLRSARTPVAAGCRVGHRAVPLPPRARAAFAGPAVPEEVALLRRIFGPEEPPFGQERDEVGHVGPDPVRSPAGPAGPQPRHSDRFQDRLGHQAGAGIVQMDPPGGTGGFSAKPVEVQGGHGWMAWRWSGGSPWRSGRPFLPPCWARR